MTYKTLKLIVTIVVAIVSIIWLLTKVIARIVFDVSSRAKAATPGTIERLKADGKGQAEKAPGLVDKIDADIRKLLKLEKKEAA